MQRSSDRTALLRFHGNVFNIFYAVQKDRCTSTVETDCIVAFPRQQCYAKAPQCYIIHIGLLPFFVWFTPYKAINQAKCFAYHSIFKLVQMIWINLVVKGISCYIHWQIRQFSSMAFSKAKGLFNFIVAFWIRHNFLNYGKIKAVLSWYMWHFLWYTFLKTCYNATLILFHPRHKTKVTLTKIH